MKHPFLVSFSFKTVYEIEYQEQRIMVIDGDEDAIENDLLDKGYSNFKQWFVRTYPESTLISAIIHPTIKA